MVEKKEADLRILVADDHPLIRAGIRACALRPEWHICAEADNGPAVIELARIHHPDIAVLDLSLPGLNGLEVARALSPEFPDLGIVIYTMHDEDQLVMDALEAGVRGWVSKNDADAALTAAIAAVAAGKTYIRHNADGRFTDSFSHTVNKTPSPALTPRELEVVKLVTEGATNRSIAARLNVSIKTVDSHRTAAMRKLDVHTVAELVRRAIRGNLIQP